jgi:hypothetical protein
VVTISGPEVFKYLAYWGPGVIIAGLMIYAIIRLGDKFIERFVGGLVTIGTDFVSAQKEQAASLAKMAQGTEGLRDCINAFVSRDNQAHREMIILQKFIRGEIQTIAEAVDNMAKQMEGMRQ